jgi:hypothetical protein
MRLKLKHLAQIDYLTGVSGMKCDRNNPRTEKVDPWTSTPR